uniref:Uncharacterized protein n=1 Tax=Octopus bimaculoides TaxID=37653 RepID=A0A0L8I094_OCTBM
MVKANIDKDRGISLLAEESRDGERQTDSRTVNYIYTERETERQRERKRETDRKRKREKRRGRGRE